MPSVLPAHVGRPCPTPSTALPDCTSVQSLSSLALTDLVIPLQSLIIPASVTPQTIRTGVLSPACLAASISLASALLPSRLSSATRTMERRLALVALAAASRSTDAVSVCSVAVRSGDTLHLSDPNRLSNSIPASSLSYPKFAILFSFFVCFHVGLYFENIVSWRFIHILTPC